MLPFLIFYKIVFHQLTANPSEPGSYSILSFQDGNGCASRLLLFKECLRNGIVPSTLTKDLEMCCCRGLQNWETEPGCLRDTYGLAQDRFKHEPEYFRIKGVCRPATFGLIFCHIDCVT
jgi:hypothetical protein